MLCHTEAQCCSIHRTRHVALWRPSKPCHAGHYCNRIHVTAVGCLLWGLMTASFGFCSSVSQGIFFWGMNGIGKPSSHNARTLDHSNCQCSGFLVTSAAQNDPMCACLLQAWRLSYLRDKV